MELFFLVDITRLTSLLHLKKRRWTINMFNESNNLLIYKDTDGNVVVDAIYRDETLWLSQKSMAKVFDVDRTVITKHLKNIFTDGELNKNSVCAKFAHTAEDGKRQSKLGCMMKKKKSKCW